MKTNLILLHGALGTKNQFKALKERLKNSFDVHDFNFEGHGGIRTDKDFSMDLFTDNLIEFLDSKSLDQVNVFGYSMGGYVALNAALRSPSRFRKIMTLASKFNWDPNSAEREVKMLNPDIIEEKVPHFAERLKKEHHPQDWKEVMKKTAAMMINLGNGARLSDDDFRKIEHNVCIGIGDKDRMVSIEESERIAKLIPNSDLVVLAGVEHPIEKVDLELLEKHILNYLL